MLEEKVVRRILEDFTKANVLGVKDFTLRSIDPPLFISSGVEIAVNNLTIESGAVIRNRGLLSIKGNLDYDGEIQNEGIIELGW